MTRPGPHPTKSHRRRPTAPTMVVTALALLVSACGGGDGDGNGDGDASSTTPETTPTVATGTPTPAAAPGNEDDGTGDGASEIGDTEAGDGADGATTGADDPAVPDEEVLVAALTAAGYLDSDDYNGPFDVDTPVEFRGLYPDLGPTVGATDVSPAAVLDVGCLDRPDVAVSFRPSRFGGGQTNRTLHLVGLSEGEPPGAEVPCPTTDDAGIAYGTTREAVGDVIVTRVGPTGPLLTELESFDEPMRHWWTGTVVDVPVADLTLTVAVTEMVTPRAGLRQVPLVDVATETARITTAVAAELDVEATPGVVPEEIEPARSAGESRLLTSAAVEAAVGGGVEVARRVSPQAPRPGEPLVAPACDRFAEVAEEPANWWASFAVAPDSEGGDVGPAIVEQWLFVGADEVAARELFDAIAAIRLNCPRDDLGWTVSPDGDSLLGTGNASGELVAVRGPWVLLTLDRDPLGIHPTLVAAAERFGIATDWMPTTETDDSLLICRDLAERFASVDDGVFVSDLGLVDETPLRSGEVQCTFAGPTNAVTLVVRDDTTVELPSPSPATDVGRTDEGAYWALTGGSQLLVAVTDATVIADAAERTADMAELAEVVSAHLGCDEACRARGT